MTKSCLLSISYFSSCFPRSLLLLLSWLASTALANTSVLSLSPPVVAESKPIVQPSALASKELIQAVIFNAPLHVKRLLQQGEDPNNRDVHGTPLLILALNNDAFDVAQILAEHPRLDIEQTNVHQETALMLACLKQQYELVKQLINVRSASINRSGWTPLHYAVTNGDIEIVRLLLDHQANVDALSPNGTTPLMMAARGGYIHLTKLLLEAGADVFLKNKMGLTAADFASQYHHQEIAEGLDSRMQKISKQIKSSK